jgi:hypothetical protein
VTRMEAFHALEQAATLAGRGTADTWSVVTHDAQRVWDEDRQAWVDVPARFVLSWTDQATGIQAVQPWAVEDVARLGVESCAVNIRMARRRWRERKGRTHMAEGLVQDVAALLNRYSQENGSNTPDFLLAEYLIACLATWNTMVVKRDQWYGVERGVPSPREADPQGREA